MSSLTLAARAFMFASSSGRHTTLAHLHTPPKRPNKMWRHISFRRRNKKRNRRLAGLDNKRCCNSTSFLWHSPYLLFIHESMQGANQNTQYPSGFHAALPLVQASPVMYQYNNSYQQPGNTFSVNSNQQIQREATAPPVTIQWKCAPCDLVLESEQALERHTASHITCRECAFQAAPKVVKAHHQARHGKFAGSGFKSVTVAIPGCQVQRFRICVGNRPEDIAEWIAERKRRFPRQKKTAEDKEEKSGLSTLLAGYGSSDEESAASCRIVKTEVEEQPITAEEPYPHDSLKAIRKRPCRYFMRNGTCRNGENCTFLHELPTSSALRDAPQQNAAKRPKRELTLLDRLLQNDKKRENALVLQLLDFIVENDFLSSSGDR